MHRTSTYGRGCVRGAAVNAQPRCAGAHRGAECGVPGGRARPTRFIIQRGDTYTRPELGHVGATSRELERAGQAFDSYRVEFGELDRGRPTPPR